MQALRTDPPGGWEHTGLREVEAIEGNADDVLIELRCAGINPADDFQIQGIYPGGPKPPFVGGRDGSGVVVRADSQGRWKEGDAVLVLQHAATNLGAGTFSERQAFPATALAPVPKGWSFAEAAAAPLVYQTAWRALVDVGKIHEGSAVAVTGASGGVGSAAVQLAHRLGAKVVAFSRSEEKGRRLLDLGADIVLAPNDDELKKKAFDAIGRKGFDIVVENVGGESLTTSVHILGPKGKVALVGLLAGVNGTVSIPSLLFKEACVQGTLVSGFAADEAQVAWKGIVDTLGQNDDRPIIDSCFAFADFQKAFARLRESPFGKVVLQF